MINVIMHAVTSVETNVNWNGARNAYFRPQRGIRQRDPISPYLFVLCMDKLSQKWKGIKVGRREIVISHLMFVDDLLLFEVDEKYMHCVMKFLREFGDM